MGITYPSTVANATCVAGSPVANCKKKGITSINLLCKRAKNIQFIDVGNKRLVEFEVQGVRADPERITVDIKPNDIFELTTVVWSKVRAKDGKGTNWKIKTQISAKKEGEATLQFKANGQNINTIKLTSKPASKDVFQAVAVNRYKNEYILIGPKALAHSPVEYDQNYCIHATSRALGKLLNNKMDFWVYDDSQNKIMNRVSLNTGTSMGETLNKKGFVKSSFLFNGYRVAMKDKLAIQKKTEKFTKPDECLPVYQEYKYDLVQLQDNRGIYKEYIKNEINGKPGYHVYLLSISGEFHVLSLLVDNTDPCNETYAIYDQEGLSTSKGALSKLDEGMRRQVSWTFTNFSLNKIFKIFTKAEAKLWKIQRK